VRGIFNQDRQAVGGSSAMVNAMNWDAATDSFDVTSAPTMRMVVDLADLDASRWVNQTGTSGHPFHPHWDDQTQAWVEGRTYPWPFTSDAVQAVAEERMTLVPGPPGR
jgi:penicillin amidase